MDLNLRCLTTTAMLLLAVACAQTAPAERTSVEPSPAHVPKGPPIAGPVTNADKPADLPGLHNVVAYGDGIYSGSVPYTSEGGFDTLARMGVKTVISVDGGVPEVEEAEKYGLRYVHLPISYNGMDEERTLEIARAVRDLPGPVYIHCHHGKHRSAGAAGAAAVTLGEMTPAEAKARMKVSGTAEGYKGLWQCVEVATVADEQRLNTASNAFPATSPPNGFTEAMVIVDEASDGLKAIEKAGWKTPADHPDLVPYAEAARLAGALEEAAATPEAKAKSEELVTWMTTAAGHVRKLEKALTARESPEELSKHMKAVQADCKSCHTKYRD